MHSSGSIDGAICPAGALAIRYNDYLEAGKLVIFVPIANLAAEPDHALERSGKNEI